MEVLVCFFLFGCMTFHFTILFNFVLYILCPSCHGYFFKLDHNAPLKAIRRMMASIRILSSVSENFTMKFSHALFSGPRSYIEIVSVWSELFVRRFFVHLFYIQTRKVQTLIPNIKKSMMNNYRVYQNYRPPSCDHKKIFILSQQRMKWIC
jgi:hypothetical protein